MKRPRNRTAPAVLLFLIGLALFAWQALSTRLSHAAPAGAPNVLVVLLDDAGYGQTSTFGGLVPTPTLDALAANGLRYTRFHVASLCSPTRASLLTGRNHHAVGMGTIVNWSNENPGYTGSIPKSAAFVSEVLRQNGYATAGIGKWHLIPDPETTLAGPFDHWP
ncbi:MAG TPA: sulfatase-like hydrolase/transferase, partial [Blastocatellia bacterium]|nr:sulfatase-like hydrolase/transferase [Blastocatellia bacterium]